MIIITLLVGIWAVVPPGIMVVLLFTLAGLVIFCLRQPGYSMTPGERGFWSIVTLAAAIGLAVLRLY